MSNINRENYERFFIDFIDGTLSDDLQAALHVFLLSHPDLATELEEVSGFKLPNENPFISDRSSNKKSLAPGENPVFPPQVFAPSKMLKPLPFRRVKGETIVFDAKSTLYRQEHQISWNLLPGFSCRTWKKPSILYFENARVTELLPKLVAPSIVFEYKEELKKDIGGARIVPLRRAVRYSSAAAAIALLVWWGNSSDSASANLAHQDQNAIIHSIQVDKKQPSIDSTFEKNSDHPIPASNKNFAPLEIDEPNVANQEQLPVAPSIDIPTPIFQKPNEDIAVVESAPSLEVPTNAEVQTPTNASNKITSNNNVKSYNSIWDYAQDKAKSSLWGNKDYPEDHFTYALLEKEINKGLKKEESPAITYKRDEENERKVFRIKLGKFEYVRSR